MFIHWLLIQIDNMGYFDKIKRNNKLKYVIKILLLYILKIIDFMQNILNNMKMCLSPFKM